MNLNGSFGPWLRQRRKVLDLTQAELAEQVGCSKMTIRKLESNERRPSKQVSERLADVLAISLADRADFLAFARRVTNDPHSPLDMDTFMPTNNLPLQSTPFIGREIELAQVMNRLGDPACRLLSLVGAGGIGKTRLALQVASQQIENFADGVYFISLTPVGSTTFIPAAIASALDFSFYSHESPDKQLMNYLRGKHMLLVMDNYEHLLGGVELLADLIGNAPRLKILVTSRERLNIYEEWVLPVDGLPFSAAVELYVQTAHRLEPNFSLDDNRAAVADICRMVEGMPLGIELAASWLHVMPCSRIAEQIKNDLNFLTTPLQNVPERHRSLRAVFEHSWGLLSSDEQNALMKLSVFRGGIDLHAAEHIAGASLSLLAGLVNKSLIRLNALDRYEMHELLRQFAADKLLECGQEAETRTCHLHFFIELTEQLEQQMFGPHALGAFDALELELDNLRAALDWASQIEDAESGLRLAGAMKWFWEYRTYWVEGRNWLEKFWQAGSKVDAAVRAKAIHPLIVLNNYLSDQGRCDELCPVASALADEITDPHLAAWLIDGVGYVAYPNLENCEPYLEEALARFRKLDNKWGVCLALCDLAQKLFQRGEFSRARELQEEGIRLARESGDKSVLSWLLMLSACRSWYQGNIDQQTEKMYQECLTIFREFRYKYGILIVLSQFAKYYHLQKEDHRASEFFKQSMILSTSIGSKWYNTYGLIGLAEISCSRGEAVRGARLLGAANDLIETIFATNSIIHQMDRKNFYQDVETARAQLGEVAFAAAFAEGQRMTLDEAVAYALAERTEIEND